MARVNILKTGELTDTSFYILLSLIKAKHGYLIMKQVEEATNGSFKIGPASLYNNLKKLLKEGMIVQIESDELRNKRTYSITSKGNQLINDELERRKAMINYAELILSKE